MIINKLFITFSNSIYIIKIVKKQHFVLKGETDYG